MRGKKSDHEFLSHFISKCISLEKYSQEDIIRAARQEINSIDEKIIEVEKMKLIRSKLLDVIDVFETFRPSNKEDEKILSFFRIQSPKICKTVCNLLKKESVKLEDLYLLSLDKEDLIFCIKQLQEFKIVSKVGDYLIRSDNYNDYMKFVLCEG